MSEFTLSDSQRLKARAIATAGYPLVAALGRTLSWTVVGEQPLPTSWCAPGRHADSGPLAWADPAGDAVLAGPRHRGDDQRQLRRRVDGAAHARFGYRAARGSTSRNGARALAQLRRELASGHAVAFTVDGPRGPARVVQPGAVWLAGATGQPILPFHIEASRCWTLGSWDRTQIPKPFSTVGVAIGPPIQVPEICRGQRQNRAGSCARVHPRGVGRPCRPPGGDALKVR